MSVQLVGTQPIDEQQARPKEITRQGDSSVEARHTHRGQHRGHHVRQVRGIRIRLGSFDGSSLVYRTPGAWSIAVAAARTMASTAGAVFAQPSEARTWKATAPTERRARPIAAATTIGAHARPTSTPTTPASSRIPITLQSTGVTPR